MLRILRPRAITQARPYSVKVAQKDVKKYTDTINLPKTKFPSRLTAARRAELEVQILNRTIAASYDYQRQHKRLPTFILHDGPPYANGELHMGHAVNKILKDITLRQHVARGQQVNYVPGWDCHGLPIELKATTAGVASQDALEIRRKSRAFALDAIESQKQEFRSWGILGNWQPEQIYMTLKPEFIANQLQMFYNLYERKLVYRDLKPVYWSPSSRTALAEAELEYDAEFESPSVYLRFAISEGFPEYAQQVYALVWTTTPWTLPSNQAICYNPALEYALVRLTERNADEMYLIATALIKDFEATTQLTCQIVQQLSGDVLSNCSYQHPIHRQQQPSLPFLPAHHVQDTKGTGLVHTAPAHGPEDFLVSLTHQMPVKNYVNEAGVYTSQAPQFLRQKPVLEQGDTLVLEHIANDVVHAGKLTHAYPIDWRTKQPVIIRASDQWFLNTDRVKERAAAALDQVEIYPRVNAEASKKALLTQLRKRPYWCISRQRAWGVPIPVLYRKDNGEAVLSAKLITHLCNLVRSEGSIDFWWSKSVAELFTDELLAHHQCEAKDLEKGKDIFDIWFDSGSTWSVVLKDKQVADLYLEGYDQFTGWFQSSLLTSIAARDCAPYKALFVHGFTVDERGYKMSKSLGNVISPKEITKKYGTDALRWWVASHGTQHMSITVSEKLLQQTAENLSKVRGTLRYLNGAIGVRNENAPLPAKVNDETYLNRYLLHSLVEFDSEIEKLYNSYEYNRVVARIQHFVANEISAIYVHLIKDRLYCGSTGELNGIRYALTHCYRQLCKALWPIVPFLVEESWSFYDQTSGGFHQEDVKANSDWLDLQAKDIINTALDVKSLINQQAGTVNSWQLAVNLKCSDNSQHYQHLNALHEQLNEPFSDSQLCEILQVGSVTLQKTMHPSAEVVVDIKSLESNICPRCRRFMLAQSSQEVCTRCFSVLNRKL